jgi:hypothetical protein
VHVYVRLSALRAATLDELRKRGLDAGRLDALAAVVGVPCLDANTLAADATCTGEKVPGSARSAYKAARKRLLALSATPTPKVRKALGAAGTRLLRKLAAVNKKLSKGKLSAECASRVNALAALLSSTISCRISG